MATPQDRKSTTDEIRRRFDGDVDRFSQLETGQVATMDAALAMELISRAAVAATPRIERVLDIGCGAGNNTLKLREVHGRDFAVDLLDLSQPMLQRAQQRVTDVNQGDVRSIEADFRTAELSECDYDVVIAAAVLHHLRDEDDWRRTFEKIYRIVAPRGSVWITDLVSHESAAVQALMWRRYGDYLASLGGDEYRRRVFDYINREDSPRSLPFQLRLLDEVGFDHVDVLHKNGCFAAFGAVRSG